MDIDTNSNGNSNQVGNLTVLIGSDPFLPQPDSPTVEPELDSVDENLNTPPLLLLRSTKRKISPNPSIHIWKLTFVWILNPSRYWRHPPHH